MFFELSMGIFFFSFAIARNNKVGGILLSLLATDFLFFKNIKYFILKRNFNLS